MMRSIFFFEPDTQQSTIRIPVRGYAFAGLLMPSISQQSNLHVVRLESAAQARELEAWRMDWQTRFDQPKDVVYFQDRSARSYWQALVVALSSKNQLLQQQIKSALVRGAMLRPFEWTIGVQSALRALSVPMFKRYGYITPSKRRVLEYRFDTHLSSRLLPASMLVGRRHTPNAEQTLRAIQQLRDRGVGQTIEVTAEGSVGGMGTVLVHPGTTTSQELLDLFQESGVRNAYSMIVRSSHEQKWSLQYEIIDGVARLLGMSEKWNIVTPDGRDLHYASMMGKQLTSIPALHRLRAHRVCKKILESEIQGGESGSMGFVWHSVPAHKTPELLYRTVRDESETIAHYILHWLKKTQRKEYVALHSRIFFRGFDWHSAHRRLGERLLFCKKNPQGVLLHVPYYRDTVEAKKGNRGIKTILLISVGRNAQYVRTISQQAIRRLGAWRQGEKER